ncbi:hypothetical protein [Alkalihalobacillus sp. AL-G]|uniref:hypothetical protein n=1 Tax=Alkalihalobacillus sp. AL-G TaxID=2926399 RepID=UPI00272C832E|nr:hypothetical protein [Alkalihalobacillus sp. AL-G]WLD91765.1 hypothetical protein MOJ78_12020 [Alkalihalobacillus sp. AL-G]
MDYDKTERKIDWLDATCTMLRIEMECNWKKYGAEHPKTQESERLLGILHRYISKHHNNSTTTNPTRYEWNDNP